MKCNFLLGIVLLVCFVPICRTMDGERIDYFSHLPTEVLKPIACFTIPDTRRDIEDEPRRIFDEIKYLRATCIKFRDLLSKETIAELLSATQVPLTSRLEDACLLARRQSPYYQDALDLIGYGASPNIVEMSGLFDRLFVYASRRIDGRAYNMIKYLLEHGFELDFYYLREAVKKTDKELVKLFLHHGAKPIAATLDTVVENAKPGMEYMHFPELAQLLIDHGAPVNDASAPLLARARTPEMIKVLLQAGAQLSFKGLVGNAVANQDPGILIEVLRTRYPYQTAEAIAVALMAGVVYGARTCSII